MDVFVTDVSATWGALEPRRTLWVFGRATSGQSVALSVLEFTPSVYIKPKSVVFDIASWTFSTNTRLAAALGEAEVISHCVKVYCQRAVGYSRDKDELYKVMLRSIKHMTRTVVAELASPEVEVLHGDWSVESQFIYASGIRLFHWNTMRICSEVFEAQTTCSREYIVRAGDVGGVSSEQHAVPPLNVLAVDIQLHGPCPVDMVLYQTNRIYPFDGDMAVGDAKVPCSTQVQERPYRLCSDRKPGSTVDMVLADTCRQQEVDCVLYCSDETGLANYAINRLRGGGSAVRKRPQRAGIAVLDMTAILKKSMVTPPLAGYTLGHAVSHEQLFPLDVPALVNAPRVVKLCYLEVSSKFILGFQEIAAASFTALRDVVGRGQQARVWNKLRHMYTAHNMYVNKYAHPLVIQHERATSNFPLPDDEESHMKAHDEIKVAVTNESRRYTGGLVQEPILGCHLDPIYTFDFQSLYPSIMEGFGLCPARVVFSPSDVQNEELKTVVVPLSQEEAVVFVMEEWDRNTKEWRPTTSILPAAIHEVVQERARVKALMKDETDKVVLDRLNARQLGCKVFQNSVYGFFGAADKYAILPLPVLMAAVCSIGQYMIMQVVTHITTRYNGIVVYGDTDSVMTKLPPLDPSAPPEIQFRDAYDTAHAIAQEVSRLFPVPNKLVFESMKNPFFISGKKNYMAMEYMPCPFGWQQPPHPVFKGFGFMKRDRCQWVQRIGARIAGQALRGDIHAIPVILQQSLQALTESRHVLDYSVFAITCELKALEEYKSHALIQVQVAHQITARTQRPVKPGSRISYVVVHGQKPFYQRGVETEHAKQARLPLDLKYYIATQLRQAIQPLIQYIPDILVDVSRVFDAALGTCSRIMTRNRDIRTMFQPLESTKKLKTNI